MRTFFISCCSLLAGLTLQAQSTWTADGAHSSVGFEITHLMISTVTGTFGEFTISATADDTFSAPSFAATIKTASVNTGVGRRDDHLRSADFFNAEANPEMSFETTSSKSTGNNSFELSGNLSMHGVTKPVTFKGSIGGIITDQRSQKLKAGVKLTTTVNRLDFGVGSDTPTLGKEVEITIRLEMAQQ